MGEPTIEVEIRGAAAWLWLNRPALHNAMNEEMIRELTLAVRAARKMKRSASLC